MTSVEKDFDENLSRSAIDVFKCAGGYTVFTSAHVGHGIHHRSRQRHHRRCGRHRRCPVYEASTINSSAFLADFEARYTAAHCPGSSKLAEQNQNQHDNEYQAESAAAVIAGPVKRPAPKPAKAPEQRDYQYNEEDSSKR